MKALILGASFVLAAGSACGQALDLPAPIAPGQAGAALTSDAVEAPMMAQPSSAGTFRLWYAAQKRPAMVVYFDKRLDQLPPGWTGSTRLLIEEDNKFGNEVEKRKMTIGVQRNTATASAQRSQFATLVEQSLQQEMKRQQFKVLDSVVLHRKQAASQPAEGTDIEYDSLKKSARFVFEVQMAFIDNGIDLLGSMKDLHNGDLVVTVRVPVDGALDSTEAIDRATRRLVQRLLNERV